MTMPSTPAEMQAHILKQLTSHSDGGGDELDILYDMLAKKLASIIAVEIEEVAAGSVELAFVKHEVTGTRAALADAGENEAVALVGEPEVDQVAIIHADPMATAILLTVSLGSNEDTDLEAMQGQLSPIDTGVFETNAGRFTATMVENGLLTEEHQLLSANNGKLALEEINDFLSVSFSFNLLFADHVGLLSVIISKDILARENLPSEEEDNTASSWHNNFKAGVMQMNIDVDAIVSLPAMTLDQIKALQPGDIMEIPAEDAKDVAISVKDKSLFIGQFGRLGNRYTIRVDKPARSKKNIVDHIISAM